MSDQGQNDDGQEGLLDLINTFLAAHPPEQRQLLEGDGSVLLHPAVETMLVSYAFEARQRGEADDRDALRWHANLLAACREQGVAQIFDWLPILSDGGRRAEEGQRLYSVLQATGDGQERTSRLSDLQHSLALCRRLLILLPRTAMSKLWAAITMTLGTVLRSLGDLTGDAETLRQAEAAYRAALVEYTRERAPPDWAMTQNNLGNVVRSLGNLIGDAETLHRAETALSSAATSLGGAGDAAAIIERMD